MIEHEELRRDAGRLSAILEDEGAGDDSLDAEMAAGVGSWGGPCAVSAGDAGVVAVVVDDGGGVVVAVAVVA